MKLKSLILLFTLFLAYQLQGKDIPPRSNTIVTDYIRLLSPTERDALERKLVAYDDSTSTQIAIVIDRSLEGEEIFDYSYRLAEAWGIGGAENSNGVLIYIAFEDRKLFIQTGYGVEGFLTDGMASRIIDRVITPSFRQQRYYQGLDQATNIIMQLGSGEYYNDGESESSVPPLAIIIILLVIVIIISSLFNDKGGDGGGYYRGGRYDSGRRRGGGWIYIPGGGGWTSGGGGGGGFGGGGFGGFGGGGFGGGGAGGSW